MQPTTETLVSTFKEIWVNEFGNNATKELENIWHDMFSTFETTLFINSVRSGDTSDIPEKLIPQAVTNVICAPMGAGKSSALKHYLKNMNKLFKALVVVERIETAESFQDYLGEEGCVAVHSQNEETLDSLSTKRILVITHSKLLKLLKNDNASDLFNFYHLIAIDEQLSTYEHFSVTPYYIQSRIIPTLKATGLDTEFGEVFNNLLKEISNFATDNQQWAHLYQSNDNRMSIDWAKLSSSLNEALLRTDGFDKEFNKDLSDVACQIRKACHVGRFKTAFLQKQGGKLTYNVVTDFFPTDTSKVILDGTAQTNDIYKLIQANQGHIQIKSYPSSRNYKGAKISTVQMPTGKSSLSFSDKGSIHNHKDESKKLFLNKLVSRVRDMYINDNNAKILFIVHKENSDYLEKIIDDNMAVTHWGRHVGINDYRNYNKVIIYGLNHRPKDVYSAMSVSTFTDNCTPAHNYEEEIETSVLSSDILQAINRIGLRNISPEGTCIEDIEVFITLPLGNKSSEAILSKIRTQMPGATYLIDDAQSPLKNLLVYANTNIKKLIKFLKAKDGLIKCTDVYQSGCMSRDEWRTISNKRNIGTTKEELESIGWTLVTPTPTEKQTYKLANRTKLVLKYVGIYNPFMAY